MADNGVLLDLTDPSIANYVYVKTNIGGWFFDAITKEEHSSELAVTTHPVQTGANIADHAYMQPRTLTMQVAMSDVATSFIDGQFSGSWSRSIRAFEVLRELQRLRLPVQVLTRLQLYQNMLVTKISVTDDYTTLSGLNASVTLQEIFVASVQTVKISANPGVTDSADQGSVQVAATSDSVGTVSWNNNGTYSTVLSTAKTMATGASN